MKEQHPDAYYAAIGRRTVKFGLQMANDIIVNVLRKLEADDAGQVTVEMKQQKLVKAANNAKASKSYWQRMTAEERRAEVARRRGLPHPSKQKQLTPRAAKYSKALKGYWANMTPEERKAEMARRIAKRAKGLVNGHATVRASRRAQA